MPEVEEVFRLATDEVKPDPNALERQEHRQRASARAGRIRAYGAVAAVLLLLVVGALAVLRAVQPETISVDHSSGGPTGLTFTTSLPGAANEQRLEIVDMRARTMSKVPGLSPDGFAPSLSADGSTIAFVAAPVELEYNQIGVMSSDGRDARFISTPGLIVGSVAISPDATQVAFEGLVDSNTDIYVVDVDGSRLRRLTDDPATDQFPQWAPDGTTIVYDNAGRREQSDPQFSSTAEIWTVPADGSAPPTRLTDDRVADSSPSFSPNGSRIAYVHGGEIRTMAADGSDQRMLLGHNEGGFTPRWSPQGDKIAFSYFSDAYRPIVQLGDTYGERPLVIVAVVEIETRNVIKLKDVAMATDLNTPQWVDNAHLLVPRVPAHPR